MLWREYELGCDQPGRDRSRTVLRNRIRRGTNDYCDWSCDTHAVCVFRRQPAAASGSTRCGTPASGTGVPVEARDSCWHAVDESDIDGKTSSQTWRFDGARLTASWCSVHDRTHRWQTSLAFDGSAHLSDPERAAPGVLGHAARSRCDDAWGRRWNGRDVDRWEACGLHGRHRDGARRPRAVTAAEHHRRWRDDCSDWAGRWRWMPPWPHVNLT